MTKDEALKLALEAYLCREMSAGTVIGDPKWWASRIANAIKEALAQPDQEPVGWIRSRYTTPPQSKPFNHHEFGYWWYEYGSGLHPLKGEDQEEHAYRVATAAWQAAHGIKEQDMTPQERKVMEQALEALEGMQNAIYNIGGEHVTDLNYAVEKADVAEQTITTIKEALAQPDQEPVKDWIASHNDICDRIRLAYDAFALTSYPPKHTWVGLTDQEVNDIVWNLPYELSQEHIRAIEAKFNEKNR